MNTSETKKSLLEIIQDLNLNASRVLDLKDFRPEELKKLKQQATEIHEKTVQLELLMEIEEKKNSDPEPEQKQSKLKQANQEVESEKNAKVDVDLDSKTELIEEKESVEEHLPDEPKNDVKSDSQTVDYVETQGKEAIQNEKLGDKPDLNQVFSTEVDPSLSGQLQKQPISDLLTAIGLNERYLYANELFGGNMEEFKEAMRRLNECENLEGAKSFCFEQLKKDYDWEDDSELFQALMTLLERRFQ